MVLQSTNSKRLLSELGKLDETSFRAKNAADPAAVQAVHQHSSYWTL